MRAPTSRMRIYVGRTSPTQGSRAVQRSPAAAYTRPYFGPPSSKVGALLMPYDSVERRTSLGHHLHSRPHSMTLASTSPPLVDRHYPRDGELDCPRMNPTVYWRGSSASGVLSKLPRKDRKADC